MNLYITSELMAISARHLDNERLKIQYRCLVDVLHHCLTATKEYKDILSDDTYTYMSLLNSSIKVLNEIKPSITKHNLITWADSSIFNFLIIINYFLAINNELKNRRNYITGTQSRFEGLVRHMGSILARIMPRCTESDMIKLSTGLYRGLPEPFSNELNTIKAYKKYLIHHWKADLKKEHEYRISYTNWKLGNGEKPRPIRRLLWGANGARR